MNERQRLNAAISFSSRQVSYLKTWLRSVENQISGMDQGDARYWGLVDERRALDREISSRSEERSMIRKAMRRASGRIRVA
jgi:hypothetical protein